MLNKVLSRLPIMAVLVMAGCQMPNAPQATAAPTEAIDPAVRRMVGNLATRFTRARQAGGMVGVSADIQSCYQQAALPRQVRDCLVLDAVARRIDMEAARTIPGGELPYFTEQAVTRRWAQHNRAGNFPDLPTQISYMRNASDAVILEMAKRS